MSTAFVRKPEEEVKRMKTELDVTIRRTGSTPIVSLSGDVDAYTCVKLKEAIIDLINQGDFRVVIELGMVNYIDSSGLGTLVGALSRVGEQSGALVIAGANPHVKKVMKITGLNKVFLLFDNEADAVRSLET